MVGSRPQAETRNLIYLVGGSLETLTQIKPILTAAGGSAIHHVGTTGQGMAMKLAVNALLGIQVMALAELIGMLTKQEITTAQAMECLGELPVLSPAAKGAGNLMLKQNHAPLFPVALVEKDFHYAIQTAQAVNAHIPVSTAVRDIYQEAIAHGYENDNITGVAQLFIS